MSAKVSADLRRIQRFYDWPSSTRIADYEEEIAQLLKNGYLGTVTFGFKRDGQWIEPTVSYTASELSDAMDDVPGAISPHADVSNATFYSFLTYSDKYWSLSSQERSDFKKSLPIQRGEGDEPSVSGYYESDKTYSSGDRSLSRKTLRSF